MSDLSSSNPLAQRRTLSFSRLLCDFNWEIFYITDFTSSISRSGSQILCPYFHLQQSDLQLIPRLHHFHHILQTTALMARRPGTQHVPHTQQQHGAHGSMEYNHSNQNVSSPSDLNARRPTQPGNQGTITQTTQTEDCHLIFQSRATLYDKTKRVRNIVHRFWLWEILAYCFSLICMGTVVVVLINEDGKPLDQWGFRITPNTVISFIVTLAKSAFLLAITETISQLKWLHFHSESHRLSDLQLFDEASRGPFGSLKLLFTRHKNSLLASCAASVMLATLFIDPFIQLVFTFPSQRTLIPLVNHASIQIAQLYDPNQYQFDSHETSAVGTF